MQRGSAAAINSGEREQGLGRITHFAGDLAGRFELGPLLERILRHAMELLECPSGSICTVDERAATYRKEADVGVECLCGMVFPLTEGVTGAIARAGGPVVFDEYASVPGGHIAARDRAGLHGVIGVPILWDETMIGSCVLFSRDAERRFQPDDVRLLELFATYAAIAMKNAELVRLAEERTAHRAARAERDRVLREVRNEIGRPLVDVLAHLAPAQDASRRVPSAGDLLAAQTAARSALSRLRSGLVSGGSGESEPVDAESLRDAIASHVAWARATSGIDIRLVTVGEAGPVTAEAGHIALRAIQEALSNAVLHGDAERVRVGLAFGPDHLAVLVDDDGRGFDVATVAAEESEDALDLGGLAARARLLGGSLVVDSTRGWGTSVRAHLPYAASTPVTRHARWRVLIVHESPVVRAGLATMLSQANPDIAVVGELGDGAQVVDAYELLHPHVVLGQLAMPGIDGARLTSYLRAAHADASVVLVIDTVRDDRVLAAAHNGVAGFVRMDGHAAELARTVVNAATRGSVGDPATAGIPDATDEPPLTERERQVRTFVERGMPDKQIAQELAIAVKTVQKHVSAILRKTGAANRTELAARSHRR